MVATETRPRRQRTSWVEERRRHDRRMIRDYLLLLRPFVRAAIDVRADLIDELSPLLAHSFVAQAGVLSRFATSGRARGRQFQAALSGVQRLTPPPAVRACHDAAVTWLRQLTEATRALERVGGGELAHLRTFHEHLADARATAQLFNRAQAHILAEWELIRR